MHKIPPLLALLLGCVGPEIQEVTSPTEIRPIVTQYQGNYFSSPKLENDSGYFLITNTEDFKKLWSDINPFDICPKIDFDGQLLLLLYEKCPSANYGVEVTSLTRITSNKLFFEYETIMPPLDSVNKASTTYPCHLVSFPWSKPLPIKVEYEKTLVMEIPMIQGMKIGD